MVQDAHPVHYRKFTSRLLALGTMAVCFLWLDSLRMWREYTATAPPYTLFCSTRAGTVSLVFIPTRTTRYEFNSTSFRPAAGDAEKAGYGRMGEFYFKRQMIGHLAGSPSYSYTVEFPIWFPYLLFVGGVLVFMRFLRGRPGAGTEKEFAARHAADNPEKNRERQAAEAAGD